MNTPPKTYVLVLQITVTDEAELATAGRLAAREIGLSDADWTELRDDASDDLVRVLNPGIGFGFEIDRAECTQGKAFE